MTDARVFSALKTRAFFNSNSIFFKTEGNSMRFSTSIWLIAVFFIASAVCVNSARSTDVDNNTSPAVFYVSVDGDDARDGKTTESAFATLERARDAARSLHAKSQDVPVQIRLGSGEYFRASPLELNESDSNTEFLGSSDGKTILMTGQILEGWRIATAEEKALFPNQNAEIWRVDLPNSNDDVLYFEHLFVNGRRATRARFPNTGFLRPQAVWEEFSMNPQSRAAEHSTTSQEIIAAPDDLSPLSLQSLTSDELHFAHFVIHHHWDTTRRIILGYDSERRALQSKGAPMKSWNPWRDSSLYYLENLRTAFDAPGEWFYDGVNRCVYYRPLVDEKIDTARFVAPAYDVNKLLIVRGKSDSNRAVNITVKNVGFSYTGAPRRIETMRVADLPREVVGELDRPGPSQFEPAQSAAFTDAVIDVQFATGFKLERCEISHTGEYGLWLKNCDDCCVQRSNFYDLGAGAVRIGGGAMDRRNSVENCKMEEGGRVFASATAVWIGQNTEEIALLHNEIRDFYYTGVSVGWVWGYSGGHAFRNRIEFNRISKIGQGVMSDMGGVYTLGTSTGTRVCNNVIFDVSSYGYGGWGLYPDEGSEGILFENNLVYDATDGSFHQHYGKDNIVRNNIFVRSRKNPARPDAPAHQIAITRVENHLSDSFERNVVYWDDGVALGYNAATANAAFENNLWFNTGGVATFNGKTHDEWSKETGKDVNGLVADPLFVDAKANDFHLRPESPAFKLGFKPFDYEQAGPVAE